MKVKAGTEKSPGTGWPHRGGLPLSGICLSELLFKHTNKEACAQSTITCTVYRLLLDLRPVSLDFLNFLPLEEENVSIIVYSYSIIVANAVVS